MYLGVDLGTSGLKIIAIDGSGSVVASATAGLSVSCLRPLWSEQNPNDWWRAFTIALADLSALLGSRTAEIKAIGLAGQMHGATFLDDSGRVLRPCMLWNDGRAAKQCEQLTSALHDFHARSGNLAMPGFTAPKVMWVREHEPDVFAETATILLPKDYLAYRLTGLYRSEASDAAGTLWLNPERREWDDALLAATGIDRSYMPELQESCDVTGELDRRVADELGLPRNIAIVIGGSDNACGAIGVGVTEPGQALLSLGTSGVLFAVGDTHRVSPENTLHAFCHCLPNRWHQMTVSLSAANSLNWFARMVGKPVKSLLDELEASNIERTGIIFLPYLSGERTPHNNPYAAGVFFGLKNSTARAELVLAILEGVAYSCADGYQAFKMARAEINDITLIGGGARSSRWRQILSDVLQYRLSLRDGGEIGPALGAARLARLSEFYPSKSFSRSIADVCPPPNEIALHIPNRSRSEYFSSQLERYRLLYQRTVVLMNDVEADARK